jgi:NAD(P)H-hydrate epimerase
MKRTCSASLPISSVSYIGADIAKAIDDRLMKEPGFSIDQLMELAGYSVACAAHDFYISSKKTNEPRNVVIFCGPGNNGGDGLVAARHIKHFGFNPYVVYPKQSKGQLFTNLVQQCHDLNITVTDILPTLHDLNSADILIDALFGFSFQGPARFPFQTIIEMFATTRTPVLSVDIPSGWHVDDGDIYATDFIPKAVISLTLPKKCMIGYQGVHYIGGR